MRIEMMSKQTGLGRKNTIDNACLFVGIIIGYSFFHTPYLFLLMVSPCHVVSKNILNGIYPTANQAFTVCPIVRTIYYY